MIGSSSIAVIPYTKSNRTPQPDFGQGARERAAIVGQKAPGESGLSPALAKKTITGAVPSPQVNYLLTPLQEGQICYFC